MTSFNNQEACLFLNLLTGNADNHFQWQVFHEKDNNRPASTWYDTLENSVVRFNQYQQQGYGVFVTLNETDGNGHHESNIIDYRSCFADIDGDNLPDNIPDIPHFITKRDDTHYHMFFPVMDFLTHEQFSKAQARIAIYFNSDMQVLDPSRVVRLPGTLHLKTDTPSSYSVMTDKVTEYGDECCSTYEQLCDAFPLNPEQQTIYDEKTAPKKVLTGGEGFNTDPVYRKRLIDWLSTIAEPAIKGQGRSYQLIRVMSMAHDLGIPLVEAQQLSWEYYNPRIVPPYKEYERKSKHDIYVERAYKYVNNNPGCRTAAGLFSQAIVDKEITYQPSDYVPVTDDSKEAVEFQPESVPDDKVITESQAVSIRAHLTSKSNISDMAAAYVGYNYPSGGLIKKSSFFSYNGKHWEEREEADIRHQINWEYGMSNFKLAPNKITNILTCVKDICYRKDIENNKWLNAEEVEDQTTLVFQNGILVITPDSKEFKPHDKDFFTLNCLPYDYDPSAKCPEMMKYLDGLFDDKTLIKLVGQFGGYTLSADAKFQKFLLLVGKSRGGKGTFTNIIRKVIGDNNIASPTINKLIKDSTLNSLSQKKLAIIPEANSIDIKIQKQVTDNLKSMTGNDPLSFDQKYAVNELTCYKWPKFILSANEVPDFADGSGALANRCIPIPITKSFAGREDTELPGRLEKECAGILNWFVECLQELYANGKFVQSPASESVLKDLKEDMFILFDFVNQHLILDENAFETKKSVYDAYLQYASLNGVKNPLSKVKVGKSLTSSYLDITNDKTTLDGKQERGFRGFRVNKDSLKPRSVAPVTPLPNMPSANGHNVKKVD